MRITVVRSVPPVIIGGVGIVPDNDAVLSSGRYPTNTEWAHALGAGRRAEETAPTP